MIVCFFNHPSCVSQVSQSVDWLWLWPFGLHIWGFSLMLRPVQLCWSLHHFTVMFPGDRTPMWTRRTTQLVGSCYVNYVRLAAARRWDLVWSQKLWGEKSVILYISTHCPIKAHVGSQNILFHDDNWELKESTLWIDSEVTSVFCPSGNL